MKFDREPDAKRIYGDVVAARSHLMEAYLSSVSNGYEDLADEIIEAWDAAWECANTVVREYGEW